jgi:hypothetical protein
VPVNPEASEDEKPRAEVCDGARRGPLRGEGEGVVAYERRALLLEALRFQKGGEAFQEVASKLCSFKVETLRFQKRREAV